MESASPSAIIDRIPSLCPRCDARIQSAIIERDGKIYQYSECGAHGTSESLLFSSSALYHRLENWNRILFPAEGGPGSAAGQTEDGTYHPFSHASPTLGVIDLTNSCNYRCPLCFAGNGTRGRSYFLDPETVRQMLQVLLTRPATPCRNVQFSGGEPTLHPHFHQILRMAREMGFTHIQVATNGSRFVDPEFVARCEEMGLHTLYLQFDAMCDDVYLKLRGKRLVQEKTTVIDNIAKTNMRVVLVPTIATGINVDQIGPIFRYALQYSRHITGISIQPAAFIGRVQIDAPNGNPFNLADLAMEFGRQTGLTRFPEDWFPLNAVAMICQGVSRVRGEALPSPVCDAHCSLGTYFYIDEQNRPFCINTFLEMEKFLKLIGNLSARKPGSGLRKKISHLRELNALAGCLDRKHAPRGLTFTRLLRSLDGWEDKTSGRAPDWFRKGFNGMFVAGMHFMDSHNYNYRRVQRCIVQYVTAGGDLIPFCSYNAGPRYRSAEETARQTRTAPVDGVSDGELRGCDQQMGCLQDAAHGGST